MKRLFLFMVSILVAGVILAQQQTVHLADIQATITDEEIIQMGQNQNASRTGAIVLNFEGLGNTDHIQNFYDGGTSQQGFHGPDLGVQFTANAMGVIDADAGGTGNIANEPSPSTVLFFLEGTSTGINVPAGFTGGFSFYYSANIDVAFVQVFSGLNGTGTMLGSATMPVNFNIGCTGDPTGSYCNWDPVGFTFAGTAKSIYFGGVANFCAFDNVTLGSDVPGYEIPVSGWALFIGIGLIVMFTLFRAWRFSRS